jgi:hypothetical protein
MLGLYRERSVGFENIVTLAALIFVAATLYSSVGQRELLIRQHQSLSLTCLNWLGNTPMMP